MEVVTHNMKSISSPRLNMFSDLESSQSKKLPDPCVADHEKSIHNGHQMSIVNLRLSVYEPIWIEDKVFLGTGMSGNFMEIPRLWYQRGEYSKLHLCMFFLSGVYHRHTFYLKIISTNLGKHIGDNSFYNFLNL